MVTVKPGGMTLHNGEPRTVAGVSVYRALAVADLVEVYDLLAGKEVP